MKNYYCNGRITFTDNSDGEPWEGTEYFEYIIPSKNKKEAKKEALERAKTEFDEEINNDYDDVKVIMDEFYETDGLAMI